MNFDEESRERILELCGLALCGAAILVVVSMSGTALLIVEPLSEILVALGAVCAVAGATLISIADRQRRLRDVVFEPDEKLRRGFAMLVLNAFGWISFLLSGVCAVAQMLASIAGQRANNLDEDAAFWSGVVYVGSPAVTALALLFAALTYTDSGD